ncbi:T-cell surface glycoprotein CD1a-like [Aplochiton taeniatus]
MVTRNVIEKALGLASAVFNYSHDPIYQCHGHIELLSDTSHSFISHTYDGKDFVSLDIQTGTWTADNPQASFYQHKREEDITCLVTGFYPRKVQVEWLGPEGIPLVEGVTSGEVLPNGDGSYQLRKELTVSLDTHVSPNFSCMVLHTSVNTTKFWAQNEESLEGD